MDKTSVFVKMIVCHSRKKQEINIGRESVQCQEPGPSRRKDGRERHRGSSGVSVYLLFRSKGPLLARL